MRIEKSPYSQFRKPEQGSKLSKKEYIRQRRMKINWALKKATQLKSQYRLVWKTLNADTPKWNFSLFEQTSLRESSDASLYSSEGHWKGPSRKQRKH